ncbi:MAG TPA: bifunctional diguanylate cyclase/phosphodiesterase [Jatrophihabitans sp.]|uniref:putative bifunctional diguanylate cyclase/phosphodiesterase n=1 Tax=Jatrophihabitans sp. TaxID=1932789 RepID=UPI002DF849D3|nr:bifunctional diguanylate cyclase/phosphodiesterase [Jatrophihabitans sp.]
MAKGTGRSRHASRAGARLFAVYAGASLLPVAVLALVLVNNERGAGLARALAQGRAQAAVIQQMAIAPAVGRADLDRGISAGEQAALQRATNLAVYSGSLTELRLRDFDGRIVFADDGSATDPLPNSDPAFRSAANGRVSAAVVPDPRDPRQNTIRVLQPIVPDVNGQATGVLELYLPYAPIASLVQAETRRTYLLLAVGLVALYLATAGISWSVTRRLTRFAERQAHNARHDSLTKLPNRAAFRDDVRKVLAQPGRRGAVVLMDLNRFKEVNDTLGHHAGDQLLRIVADRLQDGLRTDDVVARLGGDEFGVLLADLDEVDAIHALLDGLQHALREDVDIEGTLLTVEGSFGVVRFPDDGHDLSQLLIRADIAMYHGKRGAERIVFWDKTMRSTATRSHELHSELQRALDHDELVMHYQPKLDLASGRIVSVEALVRWQHPSRGLLFPGEFIPAAEASTLINPLTDWVVQRALADLCLWRRHGLPWTVAVNISAYNLTAPGFAESVIAMVHRASADPADLILEVTETAAVTNDDVALAALRTLADAGIDVSLDDFGTGATGLLELRKFPVRELKIDRVFVADLLDNVGDRSVVQAIVELAHRIGCRVVAEGVEGKEVAEWLRAVGCDLAQGYYFHRPAPWTELLPSRPKTAPATRVRPHVAARRSTDSPLPSVLGEVTPS